MMFLGVYEINQSVYITLQTISPSTGNDTAADDAPTYNIIQAGSSVASGTFDDNGGGFYSKTVLLSAGAGFIEDFTYTVRKTATVEGVTATQEDKFNIPAAFREIGEANANTVVLTGRLTSTRAAFLDKLNITGNVASANVLSQIDTIVARLGGMIELDGAVYRYTTNSLEQAPTGGGGAALDEVVEPANGVDYPAVTLGDVMRLIAGFIFGLSEGGRTEELTFRDINNIRDILVMQVDYKGNRLSITRNP